jgi:hypothetical protein
VFYRAEHVSCGLFHMAAVFRNILFDRINFQKKPNEAIQVIRYIKFIYKIDDFLINYAKNFGYTRYYFLGFIK